MKRRAAQRGRERGAAVFIVVLVLAMLSTVGLFAASAASLSTAASGSVRQTMQTHYVAEYAMLTATAELSTSRLEAYVRQMADPGNTDVCQDEDTTSGTKSCYVFGRSDLESTLGQPLFVAASPSAPGSLGPFGVDADFSVEMTDLGPASTPVAGSDLSSASTANVTYKSVTLTSVARTYLVANGQSQSLHATRAHLVVGPLPRSF